MSRTMSFAIRVPDTIVGRVKEFCKQHGFKVGAFVEQALKEKIEREELIEDSKDIIRLKYEEPAATPVEDYFAKRRI